MENDFLLDRGDDNGELGAVVTEWPDIRLTRANPGADPASVFFLASVPANNSRLSYRGKLLSTSSALLANSAVLVCTCRASSTLAAVLRRSDAVGLMKYVPRRGSCCTQIVQSAFL